MRAEANKLYTNFAKGLITEASPLAYPEGATRDELNCDMDSNMDRIRRWGFDKNGEFTNITTSSETPATYTYVWKSVNNIDTTSFLVVCTQRVLHFYEIDTGSAYFKKDFTVSLDTYRISSASVANLTSSFCTFTHGKGMLFVANKYTEPLRIEYDEDTDEITVTAIKIKVRDHYGLEDGLAVDAEPATLSKEHHYNLLNQGWKDPANTGTGTAIQSVTIGGGFVSGLFPIYFTGVTPGGPIKDFYDEVGRYPPNSKIWWAGKNSEGVFDPALLQKTYFGNTRAARGHFIIEAFNKDRTAVSGIAALTVDASKTRPEALAFTSGRVFYGHESTVYISPILEEPTRAGECYQEADPTSEDISDLLPTDGGFIEIPDADKIIALRAIADGVVVLASNGVWFINSGAQGFTTTDYSLNKVSEIGAIGPESAVITESLLFWWSPIGIQALAQSSGQFGPVPGSFDKQNITELSIKTFYNAIPEEYKPKVKGVFDPATNSIYWLYQVDSTQKRRLLIYKINEAAFVPWEVDNNGTVPLAMFISTKYSKNTRVPTFLDFLALLQQRTIIEGSTLYVNKISSANFVDRQYVDGRTLYEESITSRWPKTTYSSYIETGYEVLEDALRKKQIPFLGVFFRRTESVLVDGGGTATLQYPSSCFMIVKWSWAGKESSNKWSSAVQVYRPRSSPFYDANTDLTNREEYDIIYSRNKVRGSGRAIQFKFYEDREGYGFTLIGWHAFYQGNTVP